MKPTPVRPTMNCRDAQKYLYPFVDNELGFDTNLDLVDHLLHCTDCAHAFDRELKLKNWVRDQCCDCDAPAALKTYLARLIRDHAPKPS